MRPTLRAVTLFSLSLPVAGMILAWDRDLWPVSFNAAALALIAIFIDALLLIPARHLAIDLKTPTRLQTAEEGTADLSVTAPGRMAPIWFEAQLEQSGEAEPPHSETGHMTDGVLGLALKIRSARRGLITIDALWLRWRGLWGLMERRIRLPLERTVEILPDIRGVRDEALQFVAYDAVYGVKTQNQKGEGSEFETLRDYSQGMDNRFIDWKRSARHRKLLCKEFRQERNHQIVLGFDTGHLMLEPIDGLSRLDHAIKAGLALGWVALHHGDLIGACGFDAAFRHFIEPGRGMSYFSKLQRFASVLNYHTEETNFTLGLAELTSRLRRRALVVVFTEFVDTISAEMLIESLHHTAKRHAVLFVSFKDPLLTALRDAPPDTVSATAQAVLAGDFLRERSIVLERIARLGIHCLEAPARGLPAGVLNRYLSIKQKGLL